MHHRAIAVDCLRPDASRVWFQVGRGDLWAVFSNFGQVARFPDRIQGFANAMPEMPGGCLPETWKGEYLRGIPPTEIKAAIAFPFPALDRIRPNDDRTIDHARKVYAKERQIGVWYGVNHVSDQVIESGPETVVFTAVWNDPEIDVQALHASQPIGHQATTHDQPVGAKSFRLGVDDDFVTVFSDTGDFRRQPRRTAHCVKLQQHDTADCGEIYDSGLPDQEGPGRGNRGFKFVQFLGLQYYRIQTIFTASCKKRVHSFQFSAVCGDQQFAGAFTGHTEFLTKLVRGARTFLAKSGFEAAGFVINARVNDSAIVTCLVKGRSFLLLKNKNFGVAQCFLQLPGGGQADDSGANDDEVVFHFQ